MEFKDFFNPKWKHSEFIGKTKYVGLVLSVLVILLSCTDTYKIIDRLSMECQSGNKKACAELAEIAKNNKGRTTRRAAVQRLTDQATLAEIAKNDEDWEVREAAVEKLTDQALLAEIAKNHKGWTTRRAAVQKLTDQAALAEIAKNDKDWDVRGNAVKKLTDPDLLADIAKNDENDWVHEAAIKNPNMPKLIDTCAKVVAEFPDILKSVSSYHNIEGPVWVFEIKFREVNGIAAVIQSKRMVIHDLNGKVWGDESFMNIDSKSLDSTPNELKRFGTGSYTSWVRGDSLCGARVELEFRGSDEIGNPINVTVSFTLAK